MTWYFSAPLKFKQSSEINKLRSYQCCETKSCYHPFSGLDKQKFVTVKRSSLRKHHCRSSCFCNPAFSRVSLGQHVHLFVVAIVFNARLEKGVAATSVHSVIVFRTHHRIRGWDGRFKKILTEPN